MACGCVATSGVLTLRQLLTLTWSRQAFEGESLQRGNGWPPPARSLKTLRFTSRSARALARGLAVCDDRDVCAPCTSTWFATRAPLPYTDYVPAPPTYCSCAREQQRYSG